MSLLKEIGRRLGPVVGRGPFSGPPESVDVGIWENGKPDLPEVPEELRTPDPGRLDSRPSLDPKLTQWGITDAIAVATRKAKAGDVLLDQALLGYTRAEVLAKEHAKIQRLQAEIQAFGRPAATDGPLEEPAAGGSASAQASAPASASGVGPGGSSGTAPNGAAPAGATPTGTAPAGAAPGGSGAGGAQAPGPAGLIEAGLRILNTPAGQRIVRAAQDRRQQEADDREREGLDREGNPIANYGEADGHTARADEFRRRRGDAPQFDEHAQGNLAQQVAIALAGLLGGDATGALRAANADARERESVRYGNAQTRFEREEGIRSEEANAEDRRAAEAERRELGRVEGAWRTRQDAYARLDRRETNRREDAWRRDDLDQRRRDAEALDGRKTEAEVRARVQSDFVALQEQIGALGPRTPENAARIDRLLDQFAADHGLTRGAVDRLFGAGGSIESMTDAEVVEAAWRRLGPQGQKAFAGLEWRVLNEIASEAEVAEYHRKTRALGGGRLTDGWSGRRLAQGRGQLPRSGAASVPVSGVPVSGAPVSGVPVSGAKGVDPGFDLFVERIAQSESRGRYDARGPVARGDRTYGRYGIRGANVAPWTKRHLGRAMTPEEFLRDPGAQDAVARGELRRLVSAYGIDGARTAWVRGEGAVARRPERRGDVPTVAARAFDRIQRRG